MTKEERIKLELNRLQQLKDFDAQYDNVVGIDEVGRGPLAGPVVVCGIILDRDVDILYINDSKKVTKKRRFEIFDQLNKTAKKIVVAVRDNNYIDKYNILEATKSAMLEVYEQFDDDNIFLVDAVDLKKDNVVSIIKGDEKSLSIAAASIYAKVYRDNLMLEYSKKYVQYKFDKNSGYGTKEHRDALIEYGPCEIHRKTFITKILKGDKYE